MNNLIITVLCTACLVVNSLNAQLFFDDFGTGFGPLNGLNWDCKSANPTNNSSLGDCAGTGDYGAYLYNSQYLTTESVFIPGTGYSLTFQYAYNNTTTLPVIQVATGGAFCWSLMTWTTVATLPQSATCSTACVSLDAYAGQSIYIKFLAGTSFTSWYLDEVVVDAGVCGGGGGSPGANYKWADSFNDNDLVLDYPGNDGDEDCATCGPWVLSPGASLELVPAAGWNGSSNKTEAFTGNMNNVYYVKLDRNEYIESPVLDMSGMESVKISFHAKSSSPGTGGGDQWSFSDRLKLEIWDGTTWQTVSSLRDDLSATWTGVDDYISAALPFNYYCFSAYKSISSPGNYYYNTSPNMDPSWFHTGFKFRVIFEGGFTGSPFAWVDDFTFRADADGYSTMIPCGISFWNEPSATSFGQDPGITGNNNAEKGVELELDNSINIPPIWASQADDGDTITQVFGAGESERVVFCVISEHEIDFTYPRVHWEAPDIGWQSTTMSKDNNYSGPGWKYYAVEYISCDLASGSIPEPTTDFNYYFSFDYGLSGFIPSYFHLNTSGIEVGGGVTSTFETFNAPDVISSDECGTLLLPIHSFNFKAIPREASVELIWNLNADHPKEVVLERSPSGTGFQPVSTYFSSLVDLDFRYLDTEVEESRTWYYRLKVVMESGNTEFSEILRASLESNLRDQVRVSPNPGKVIQRISIPLSFGTKFSVDVYDLNGKLVHSQFLEKVAFSDQPQIHTNHLLPGVYFFVFKNKEMSLTTKWMKCKD